MLSSTRLVNVSTLVGIFTIFGFTRNIVENVNAAASQYLLCPREFRMGSTELVHHGMDPSSGNPNKQLSFTLFTKAKTVGSTTTSEVTAGSLFKSDTRRTPFLTEVRIGSRVSQSSLLKTFLFSLVAYKLRADLCVLHLGTMLSVDFQ